MRRQFCPVSKCFYESTPSGWRKLTDAPPWALDSDSFTIRFIDVWQTSKDAMSFWATFYWLSWIQIESFSRRINAKLEELGLSHLKEMTPPDFSLDLSPVDIDALLESGALDRIVPKEIAELEDYDAVAAMWSAQPNSYDPLNPKHISVGEAGNIRFRAKR